MRVGVKLIMSSYNRIIKFYSRAEKQPKLTVLYVLIRVDKWWSSFVMFGLDNVILWKT